MAWAAESFPPHCLVCLIVASVANVCQTSRICAPITHAPPAVSYYANNRGKFLTL